MLVNWCHRDLRDALFLHAKLTSDFRGDVENTLRTAILDLNHRLLAIFPILYLGNGAERQGFARGHIRFRIEGLARRHSAARESRAINGGFSQLNPAGVVRTGMMRSVSDEVPGMRLVSCHVMPARRFCGEAGQ